MRFPRLIAATALSLVLLGLCACTDQIGLAHGDPGHEAGSRAPPVGATSSNATVATAAAVPMSASSAAPLPGSTLQPSLPAIEAANATAAGIPKVFSSVTVTFSEHAQELAATDPRLTVTEVAAAVEQELASRQLLAPGTAAPPLAITVADLSSTLASNAAVLGFSFRNVTLIGDVTISGPAGRATIDVHARVRLTSRDASGKSGSLQPLYRRFAQLVVADLRGVEPPSEGIPR